MPVRSKTLQQNIIPLTTTFADCENTTSEIDIVTVTVPANIMADGDEIYIDINSLSAQNSGGSISLQQKITIDTTDIVNLSTTVSNTATAYYKKHTLRFFLSNPSGDNIDLTQWNAPNGTSATSIAPSMTFGAMSAGSYTKSLTTTTTIDKTATHTIYIKLKWASANANAYHRQYSAQAYIIKKAV